MDGEFEQWCSDHLIPPYTLPAPTLCSECAFDCTHPGEFSPCLFGETFSSSPLETLDPALEHWSTSEGRSITFSPLAYEQSSPRYTSELISPSIGISDCPPLPPPLPLEALIVSPLLEPLQPSSLCRCNSPTVPREHVASGPEKEPMGLTSDEDYATPEDIDDVDEEPHLTSSPDSKRFNCPLRDKDGSCTRTFTRKSDAIRHARSVHCPTKDFTCPTCGHTFARPDAIAHHLELKRCFQKRGRKKGVPQPRKGSRGRGKGSKGKGKKGGSGKRV